MLRANAFRQFLMPFITELVITTITFKRSVFDQKRSFWMGEASGRQYILRL